MLKKYKHKSNKSIKVLTLDRFQTEAYLPRKLAAAYTYIHPKSTFWQSLVWTPLFYLTFTTKEMFIRR